MLRHALLSTALVTVAMPVLAQTDVSPAKEDVPEKPKIYSPYAERAEHMPSFAEGVFWGDTHLHTRLSSDAGMIGNLLGPDDAYLPAHGEATAPTFMVGALKDAWSGNLDRIQIVKGWVDDNGERQERIYDVACADRGITDDGQCDGPVGNTVDEANATYLNNIGDAEMRTVWTDPDFNPAHRAVYYARVLEIPTPTWQAFDQQFFEMEMSGEIPLSHQERAYTSPIWFTPEG